MSDAITCIKQSLLFWWKWFINTSHVTKRMQWLSFLLISVWCKCWKLNGWSAHWASCHGGQTRRWWNEKQLDWWKCLTSRSFSSSDESKGCDQQWKTLSREKDYDVFCRQHPSTHIVNQLELWHKTNFGLGNTELVEWSVDEMMFTDVEKVGRKVEWHHQRNCYGDWFIGWSFQCVWINQQRIVRE